MPKKWWMSKTLWVNILAIIAFAIQTFTGVNWLSGEMQATILGIINVFLRMVTKEKIIWK